MAEATPVDQMVVFASPHFDLKSTRTLHNSTRRHPNLISQLKEVDAWQLCRQVNRVLALGDVDLWR